MRHATSPLQCVYYSGEQVVGRELGELLVATNSIPSPYDSREFVTTLPRCQMTRARGAASQSDVRLVMRVTMFRQKPIRESWRIW